MRIAAVTLASVGALVSLYVLYSSYQNNLATSYPFPPAFLPIGIGLAIVGLVGGTLTWRSHRFGPWVLLLSALGAIVAWPWAAAAGAYLLAAIAGFVSRRSPQVRG